MFVCHSEKSASKRVRSFKILQYISKHNPQRSCWALITNCFSWCSAQIHVTEDHLECRRNTASVWFQLSGRLRREKLLKQKIQTSLGNMPGLPSQVKKSKYWEALKHTQGELGDYKGTNLFIVIIFCFLLQQGKGLSININFTMYQHSMVVWMQHQYSDTRGSSC